MQQATDGAFLPAATGNRYYDHRRTSLEARRARHPERSQAAHDHDDPRLSVRVAAAPEGTDAAAPAEQMMDPPRAELIVAQHVLAAQQPEIVDIDRDQPGTRLVAERAIALQRAVTQIDVGCIANGAALSATGTGLLHDFSPSYITKTIERWAGRQVTLVRELVRCRWSVYDVNADALSSA
jgi:hypothetical protein